MFKRLFLVLIVLSSVNAHSWCRDELCNLIKEKFYGSNLKIEEQRNKNIREIKNLINSEYDIKRPISINFSYNNASYMHFAAMHNRYEIIKMLYEKDLKIDTLDDLGHNILHAFSDQNEKPGSINKLKIEKTFKIIMDISKKEKVRERLLNGKDQNKEETPIFKAVKNNNSYIFNLFAKKTNLFLRNNKGYSVSHLAIKEKSIDVLKEIIKISKSDVDLINLERSENRLWSNKEARNITPIFELFLNNTDEIQIEMLNLIIPEVKNINHVMTTREGIKKTCLDLSKEKIKIYEQNINTLTKEENLDLIEENKRKKGVQENLNKILINNGAKTYKELSI